MNKIALITGATSGIGKSTAELLAENGYDLIICGRRKQRLEELKGNLISKSNIKIFTLVFDVRERKEVENKIDELPENWKKIDVLVNNAGLASGLDTIQNGDIEDWEKMIDTNVKGLLYISRKIMPLMIEYKTGHIVNLGSIAGKEVYANGNIYCATKHAVDAITKAMRIDMLKHGIKVTSISPGMVETEFSEVRFHGDKEKAAQVYSNLEPLHPEDIADTILYVITRSKNVNINDILIMPTAQANSSNIVRNKNE